MFGKADLKYELSLLRKKTRKDDENLISEAKKILKQDLFMDKKILQNLPLYRSSFEVPDEENLDASDVFTLSEIKRIAVLYRLKFLDGNLYKSEIPYEALEKIQHLNNRFRKEIKDYKVLSTYESFKKADSKNNALLFVKTNYDNYYLIHNWGKALKEHRKLIFLPLRNFENLVATVVLATLIITVSLPTRLITLDHHADYWSGYRAAAFFHLLIFDFGVTVYFTFAFAKNFSNTVWNRLRDFD